MIAHVIIHGRLKDGRSIGIVDDFEIEATQKNFVFVFDNLPCKATWKYATLYILNGAESSQATIQLPEPVTTSRKGSLTVRWSTL
jgi:hypothetical protein